MEQYKCKTLTGGHTYVVTVPGSKSVTNRALLLGALSEGKTTLHGVLFSDDSRVFMKALQEIGFEVQINEGEKTVSIVGQGGKVSCKADEERKVYVGSAGTAARFLTAMLALSGGKFYVDSSSQMKTRPMKPLLCALEQMGVLFQFEEKPYAFPFRILGRTNSSTDVVELNIDESSQFLSALLLSGVMCKEGVTIRLTGKRDAKAYVTISMKMMDEFGCKTKQIDNNTYQVLPNQVYRACEYQIEPDVSAACYFYAIAALTSNEVLVKHVHESTSQGDIHFLDVLKKMGCEAEESPEGIVVRRNIKSKLKGISVNMSDFSDQTMTLAAIAPFAEGDTVIDGVSHIRNQESDRIHAIVTELTRMGIACEEREDGLTIHPGKIKPSVIETYEDHRMAMAFAVVGCAAEGIVIDNPSCCRKTFENFFEVLTNLDLTTNID